MKSLNAYVCDTSPDKIRVKVINESVSKLLENYGFKYESDLKYWCLNIKSDQQASAYFYVTMEYVLQTVRLVGLLVFFLSTGVSKVYCQGNIYQFLGGGRITIILRKGSGIGFIEEEYLARTVMLFE
ncbi:MAG: hypothetical protein P8X74_23860 [Reinekea sp.]